LVATTVQSVSRASSKDQEGCARKSAARCHDLAARERAAAKAAAVGGERNGAPLTCPDHIASRESADLVRAGAQSLHRPSSSSSLG